MLPWRWQQTRAFDTGADAGMTSVPDPQQVYDAEVASAEQVSASGNVSENVPLVE
jgi:hypothetical protein